MKRTFVLVPILAALFGAPHSNAQSPSAPPTPAVVPVDTPSDKVAPTPYQTPAPSLKVPSNANSTDPVTAVKALKAALIKANAVAQQAQRDVEAILQNNNLRATNGALHTSVSKLEKELEELRQASDSDAKGLAESKSAIMARDARIATLTSEKTNASANVTTMALAVVGMGAFIILLIIYAIMMTRRYRKLEEGSASSEAEALADARERHLESIKAIEKRHQDELQAARELFATTHHAFEFEKSKLEGRVRRLMGNLAETVTLLDEWGVPHPDYGLSGKKETVSPSTKDKSPQLAQPGEETPVVEPHAELSKSETPAGGSGDVSEENPREPVIGVDKPATAASDPQPEDLRPAEGADPARGTTAIAVVEDEEDGVDDGKTPHVERGDEPANDTEPPTKN